MTRVPARDGLQHYSEVEMDDVQAGDRVRVLEEHDGVQAGEIAEVLCPDPGSQQLIVRAPAARHNGDVWHFQTVEVAVPLDKLELVLHDEDGRL